MRGAQLKLCATPCPFPRATSPSLIVCLSSLLKTIKINGDIECRCVWKTRIFWRISGRSLLSAHAWSPFGWLSYCTTMMTIRNPCRRNKQCSLINGTATHELAIVYDASHQSYVGDNLSTKPFWSPIWRPVKMSPKSRETQVWDKALPSRKFSRQLARDICSCTKIIFFLIMNSVGATVPWYTFLESSRIYRAHFKL